MLTVWRQRRFQTDVPDARQTVPSFGSGRIQ